MATDAAKPNLSSTPYTNEEIDKYRWMFKGVTITQRLIATIDAIGKDLDVAVNLLENGYPCDSHVVTRFLDRVKPR